MRHVATAAVILFDGPMEISLVLKVNKRRHYLVNSHRLRLFMTGHAEVVQISYDPEQVSYDELLEIFFRTHDPTTLNRQGADVGTQYRSIVLYHHEEQRKKTEKVISELESAGIWNDPIVTQVEPFHEFYRAEGYHQEYFKNNPDQGYCRIVIQPKVEKFEKVFREKMK